MRKYRPTRLDKLHQIKYDLVRLKSPSPKLLKLINEEIEKCARLNDTASTKTAAPKNSTANTNAPKHSTHPDLLEADSASRK